DDLRGARRGWRVAAPTDRDLTVDQDHRDPGEVAGRERRQRVPADPAGRRVADDEVGLPALRERAPAEPVDARGVARGARDRFGRRQAAHGREQGERPQHAQRDDARARGRVVADDDPVRGARGGRDAVRVGRGLYVSALDDLYGYGVGVEWFVTDGLAG